MEPVPTAPCGGLVNLGATCAVNSLIQIIAHNTTLRTILLAAAPKESTTISSQLTDIIDKIYTRKLNVSPAGFMKALYTAFSTLLRPGDQHDIGELWMLIADKIAEEQAESQAVPQRSSQKTSPIDKKVQQTVQAINGNKSSAWLNAIQGTQLSVLRCHNCQDQPWNPEVFTSIQIEIPHSPDATPAIEDLLLNNHVIEKLDGWTCDKCKKQGADKQIQMHSLSKVLMVVIKRFQMTRTGDFAKVYAPVNISANLVFSFNDHNYAYILTGIGNHYGNGNGGHYIALTRDSIDSQSWTCYDDMAQTPVPSDHEFLNENKDAYILCYERI